MRETMRGGMVIRRAMCAPVLASVVFAGVALSGTGCGPKPPEFASEREELAYLEALASPTPDQFRRRADLDVSASRAEVDAILGGSDRRDVVRDARAPLGRLDDRA